jgi:hypothetical protein
MATVNLTDDQWIRQAFMLPKWAVTQQDEMRRVLTSASYKFTDTTLGGSFAINTPPQFTRWADIKVPSRFAPSKGMGRYYSEAIDDTGQFVHMRFGVPQFNSLTNFFFNFYNPKASMIARTGRSTQAFYSVGKALGFVVTLPLQPLIWMGSVVNFLTKKPVSKFYYLKPAMPLYWGAVNVIANQIAVNMGIIPRVMSADEQHLKGDAEEAPTQSDIEQYHTLLPNVFRKDGGVDIYAVATRAQRLAHRNRENMKNIADSASGRDAVLSLRDRMLEFNTEPVSGDPGSRGFPLYTEEYTALTEYTAPVSDESEDQETTGDAFDTMASFADFSIAELEDGAQFVTFRVDDPGPTTESFSSTVGESDLAGKINGISSQARTARFSFADGNIGDGPVADFMEGAIGAVKGVATGFLDSVNMSGIMALSGNAFADIPKVWESSEANLPSSTYTIELRSPYGNKMSRYINLMIPLSMLLAAALPISTGKQSFTSPFLCEMYAKGRNQIRLGMIESLSITRGTGNVGWTKDGEPLGIDVTFTVVDMSTVMHMPISPQFGAIGAAAMRVGGALGESIGAIAGNREAGEAVGEGVAAAMSKSTFDDDNAFTDYMAVLGSLSLSDQIYPMNKLKLNLTRRMSAWEQWKSPAYQANWTMGTFPGRVISAMSHVSERTTGR